MKVLYVLLLTFALAYAQSFNGGGSAQVDGKADQSGASNGQANAEVQGGASGKPDDQDKDYDNESLDADQPDASAGGKPDGDGKGQGQVGGGGNFQFQGQAGGKGTGQVQGHIAGNNGEGSGSINTSTNTDIISKGVQQAINAGNQVAGQFVHGAQQGAQLFLKPWEALQKQACDAISKAIKDGMAQHGGSGEVKVSYNGQNVLTHQVGGGNKRNIEVFEKLKDFNNAKNDKQDDGKTDDKGKDVKGDGKGGKGGKGGKNCQKKHGNKKHQQEGHQH